MIPVKRLCRIVWRTMSYASAILLLATIALWVRSYYVREYVTWSEPRSIEPREACPRHVSALTFAQSRGRFLLGVEVLFKKGNSQDPGGWAYERNSQIELSELPTDGIFDGVPKPPLFDHLGVIIQRADYASADYWTISWPLYMSALLFAIAPVLWLRGRSRRKPGFCKTCGYDLRATPHRCPECGTVPVKARG
jgi:hypothetical protein